MLEIEFSIPESVASSLELGSFCVKGEVGEFCCFNMSVISATLLLDQGRRWAKEAGYLLRTGGLVLILSPSLMALFGLSMTNASFLILPRLVQDLIS